MSKLLGNLLTLSVLIVPVVLICLVLNSRTSQEAFPPMPVVSASDGSPESLEWTEVIPENAQVCDPERFFRECHSSPSDQGERPIQSFEVPRWIVPEAF